MAIIVNASRLVLPPRIMRRSMARLVRATSLALSLIFSNLNFDGAKIQLGARVAKVDGF
ncbi:hypothetical protein [Luteimonas sp. A478]